MKIPVKIVSEQDAEIMEEQKQDEVQQHVETEALAVEPEQASTSESVSEPPSAEQPVAEPATAESAAQESEDELTRLQKALDAKTQEAKDHLDARLRLQAEFDNFKKRKEKDIQDFRRYANEDILREMLSVADDFDRAIAAAEQTHKLEDFLKGIEMIFDKFLGALKRKGIKEIDAEGQPFNPEIHEAVMQMERDDVEEGTVVSVFQKGYMLHDRVIVAPKVAVSKKK